MGRTTLKPSTLALMSRLAELTDTDVLMATMWLLAMIGAVAVLVRLLVFLAHEFRVDLREYRAAAQRRRLTQR